MSNLVVTGGCGFIGRHLVRRLLAEGHMVYVVDDLSNSTTYPKEERMPVVRVEDITRAKTQLAFKSVEAIFHLAAVSRTPTAIADPVRCWKTNVAGTVRVLEAARKAGVPRVVVASSNVVYGAATPYKASKLAAEEACEIYNDLYRQSVIALRFSNVYGPGFRQGDIAVFASLRDSMKRNGYIEITGDGTQTRSFTHVSDIVEGLMKAWKSDHRGILDLATPVNTSLNEVAMYFDCPIRYVPEREGDVKHIVQDARYAMSILGWEATVALKDGIGDIFE